MVTLEQVQGVRRVRAVGDDAKLMMGRTPDNVETIRPLRHGVIADLEVAEEMIKHFIAKAKANAGVRLRGSPEIVLCVPPIRPPSNAARSAMRRATPARARSG